MAERSRLMSRIWRHWDNGDFFDEDVFDRALGLEDFFEGADEAAEDVERFAFHDDGLGEHAVTEVVAGGVAVPGGRGCGGVVFTGGWLVGEEDYGVIEIGVSFGRGGFEGFEGLSGEGVSVVVHCDFILHGGDRKKSAVLGKGALILKEI